MKISQLVLVLLWICIGCTKTTAQMNKNMPKCKVSGSLESWVPDRDVNLYKIQIDKKWGLINQNGHVVLSPQWKYIESFFEQRALFKNENDKIGFLDEQGNISIKPQFEDATRFHEGLAAVKTDGKWGYIDRTGKIVVPAKFLIASLFYEGRAFVVDVRQSGANGYLRGSFIDKHGNWVTGKKFKSSSRFSENYAIVNYEENGIQKSGILDQSGNLAPLNNLYIDRSEYFQDGLAPALEIHSSSTKYNASSGLLNQSEKFGFVNGQGRFIIQPQFDTARKFSGCVALVKENDKWGAIDVTGNFLIYPQFDNEPHYLGHGIFAVAKESKFTQKDQRYRLMDLEGASVGKEEFIDISEYHDGLAIFKDLHGKQGFIDVQGNIIVNASFDEATFFFNGLAFVKANGEQGYITRSGQYVWRAPIAAP
jgi:hypothetical protein